MDQENIINIDEKQLKDVIAKGVLLGILHAVAIILTAFLIVLLLHKYI